jgi:hypothetical protein
MAVAPKSKERIAVLITLTCFIWGNLLLSSDSALKSTASNECRINQFFDAVLIPGDHLISIVEIHGSQRHGSLVASVTQMVVYVLKGHDFSRAVNGPI